MRRKVLVAIMNKPLDWRIACEQHWYRIPISSQRKWLEKCWPPEWLAFYQTQVFGYEAYAVRYYAQVLEIRQVFRWQLLPDQPRDEKSERRYHQLFIGSMQQLPRPIRCERRRRLVFIPTTWDKFVSADEINDLYGDSPLEDRLWAAFKRSDIPAERQELVHIQGQFHFLDFAIYCANGKLDVETDGDLWHIGRESAARDNKRDNALKPVGWQVLRFTTSEIREELDSYCLPTVAGTINSLGGVDEGRLLPRRIDLSPQGGLQQLSLLDNVEDQ